MKNNTLSFTICALAIVLVFAIVYEPDKPVVDAVEPGDWLVMVYSGDKVVRHWVLTDSSVDYSDKGGVWCFEDSDGLPQSVPCDSRVMRIVGSMDEFLGWYRDEFGIPEGQVALE